MRYHYDDTDDALYVELASVPSRRQVLIDEGTIVDLDGSGRVVGIEVIAASNGWSADAILERFPLPEEAAEYLRELARQSVAFAHARPSGSDPTVVIDRIR